MNDRWRDVLLGELFDLDNTKLGPHFEEPVILSLSKYDGFVPSTDYFDKRIASTKLDGYKLVPPGVWAYSTIHIDEGSIARNTLGVTGVISPMYTTMRWRGSDHDPRYLEYLLRTPQMQRVYSDSAQGSINRRRSLSFSAFAAITVHVPPLAVQRRIVKVVEAVDAHIATCDKEVRFLADLMMVVATTAFSDLDGSLVSYQDMCEHIIGGSWGDPPGMGGVEVLALGPSVYSDGRLEVDPDLAASRSLSQTRAAKRLLQADDVLLERSGGSPEQPVGRVVYAGEGAGMCVPSDFQRLLRPDRERVVPRYFFWRLWTDWRSGVPLAFSRRTTGINNLDVPAYIQRQVAWGTYEHQMATSGALDAIHADSMAVRAETASLKSLRARLLTALLSRELELPEAYDVLVDVGVT